MTSTKAEGHLSFGVLEALGSRQDRIDRYLKADPAKGHVPLLGPLSPGRYPI